MALHNQESSYLSRLSQCDCHRHKACKLLVKWIADPTYNEATASAALEIMVLYRRAVTLGARGRGRKWWIPSRVQTYLPQLTSKNYAM